MVLMSPLFTDCFAAFVGENEKMNYSRWNSIHSLSAAAASRGPTVSARHPACKTGFSLISNQASKTTEFTLWIFPPGKTTKQYARGNTNMSVKNSLRSSE